MKKVDIKLIYEKMQFSNNRNSWMPQDNKDQSVKVPDKIIT